MNRGRLDSIQALRATAALLVVGFHLEPYAGRILAADLTAFTPFRYFGYGGVNIFFVISGFIIYHSCRFNFFRTTYFPEYILKRLWRVYPIYWISLAISWIVMGIIGLNEWCSGTTPSIAIINILLLSPAKPNCAVPQAWSLSWELLFYISFGLVFVMNKTTSLATLTCAGTMSLLAAFLLGQSISGQWGVYNLHFILGIGVACLSERSSGAFANTSIALGLFIIFISILLNAYGYVDTRIVLYRFFQFAIPSALILYGLIMLERRGLRIPRTLTLLGNASYSIYLFHILVLWIFRQIGAPPDHDIGRWFYLFVILLTSVWTPVLIYRYIEMPLLRLPKGAVRPAIAQK